MITTTGGQPPYCTRFSDGVHEAWADTSSAKGGSDAGFHPHDLLEAALATCVHMTLRMYAESHAVPLTSSVVRVQLDRSQPEQPVFRYEVELYGDELTEEQRAKLLQIAEKCPVRRTLSKPLRFAQGIEAAAAQTNVL